MIEGRQAECGGAAISRRDDAPWPEGSFQKELGLWQQEWSILPFRGAANKSRRPYSARDLHNG